MRDAVKTLDHALVSNVRNSDSAKSAVLDDANGVDGMVRFDHGKLPWHADRPAIALYDTFAGDTRLSNDVRSAATAASKAVGDLVLAHSESHGSLRLTARIAAMPSARPCTSRRHRVKLIRGYRR